RTLAPLEVECPAQHLAVERPREAPVAREDEERDAAHLPPLQQRQVAEGRRGARGADHQLHHPVRVRAHLLDARLRTPQAGAGDELERLRDLARVADRRDAPADVLQRGHQTSADSSWTLNPCLNFSSSPLSFSASSSGRSPVSRICSYTEP